MSIQRNATQEERTLALLKSRGQAWTPAPELAAISLQYCRVIACLRRRGLRIENRVETRGVVKHGFYRLLEENPVSIALRAEPAEHRDAALFSDAELERTARWEDLG